MVAASWFFRIKLHFSTSGQRPLTLPPPFARRALVFSRPEAAEQIKRRKACRLGHPLYTPVSFAKQRLAHGTGKHVAPFLHVGACKHFKHLTQSRAVNAHLRRKRRIIAPAKPAHKTGKMRNKIVLARLYINGERIFVPHFVARAVFHRALNAQHKHFGRRRYNV